MDHTPPCEAGTAGQAVAVTLVLAEIHECRTPAMWGRPPDDERPKPSRPKFAHIPVRELDRPLQSLEQELESLQNLGRRLEVAGLNVGVQALQRPMSVLELELVLRTLMFGFVERLRRRRDPVCEVLKVLLE